jgi:uncharacterized protein YggT (Ycf19 family)
MIDLNSSYLFEFSSFYITAYSEGSTTLAPFSILLLNMASYLYIIIKFFKVLCYAKLTCEWFPMINPYNWPFSFFQTVTGPYFRLWSKILPALKFQKSSVEISGIIALEALNAIIYFCVRFINILILYLETVPN